MDVLVLKDGRTLHNVSFVSFSPTTIMAKWDEGRGTIRYEDLPGDIAAEISKLRPAENKVTGITRPAASSLPNRDGAPAITPPVYELTFNKGDKHVVSGQVFISTKGGNNIKLGAVTVELYTRKDFEILKKWRFGEGNSRHNFYYKRSNSQSDAHDYSGAIVSLRMAMLAGHAAWLALPESPYRSETDADGRFRIEHDIAEDFVVFAVGKREVVDSTEYYLWSVPSDKIGKSGELLLNNSNMN